MTAGGGLGVVASWASWLWVYSTSELPVVHVAAQRSPAASKSRPNVPIVLEIVAAGGGLVAEALAHGMVNYVVPRANLDEKVDALLASIVASSPTAIGMGRRALAMIDGVSLEAGLEYAQRVLPQMARTQDAREGFRAFNEKRSPVWTGR